MNQHRPYTAAENDYLRAHYATATRQQIEAAVPGRTWVAISNQAVRLKATGRPLVVPVKERTSWHPANVALLLALYPTGGADAVVAATGLTANAVRNKASRLRLAYVAQYPARAPRPYCPRAPKAVAAPKVAGPPVARAPRSLPLIKAPRVSTPNVNAAMARKRLAEPVVSITAFEISKLKPDHEGRQQYSLYGRAGWDKWKAAQ